MLIYLARLGMETVELDVPEGSTVANVLDRYCNKLSDTEIYLNGEKCFGSITTPDNHLLRNGDTIRSKEE